MSRSRSLRAMVNLWMLGLVAMDGDSPDCLGVKVAERREYNGFAAANQGNHSIPSPE